jgi:hypothetical protein
MSRSGKYGDPLLLIGDESRSENVSNVDEERLDIFD